MKEQQTVLECQRASMRFTFQETMDDCLVFFRYVVEEREANNQQGSTVTVDAPPGAGQQQ